MNATPTPKPEPQLLPDPSAALVRAFTTIGETRMKDIPFLNPALRVEAIGFRPWQQYWLGILLTPWTMNLLLTPRNAEQWPQKGRGNTVDFSFPFGNYTFILAHEDLLGEGRAGDYMMCALFSPVQQFNDHKLALDTAIEVLKQLFQNDPDASAAEESLSPAEETARPQLSERLQAPMSKRDFLRGGFLRRQTKAERS